MVFPLTPVYTNHGPVLVLAHLLKNPLSVAASISAFSTGFTPFFRIFSCLLSGIRCTGWSSGSFDTSDPALQADPALSFVSTVAMFVLAVWVLCLEDMFIQFNDAIAVSVSAVFKLLFCCFDYGSPPFILFPQFNTCTRLH